MQISIYKNSKITKLFLFFYWVKMFLASVYSIKGLGWNDVWKACMFFLYRSKLDRYILVRVVVLFYFLSIQNKLN